MFLKFIDREKEIDFLNKRYRKGGFDLIIIYGRRRIGKTELIKEFIKNKPHIYFLCDKKGTERNVLRFKKKISFFFGEPVIATNDLEEIFSYLMGKVKEKAVIVFDEFSYLIEKDKDITSVFQVIVDELLSRENIMLILCGSSVSMMEQGTLSYKSPLYGRKTGHLNIQELGFKELYDFFPKKGTRELVEIYAILGGVPFYVEKFSPNKSIFENIYENIILKEGKLYEEIDFLLKTELREPDVYKTIIESVAGGATKVVEIANRSGIRAGDIDKYLKTLIRLGILKKHNPVTELKTKRSIYGIEDNFFDFWFRFCEPYKSDLEVGETKVVRGFIKNNFNSYVGEKFERLVSKHLNLLFPDLQKTGKWWGYYREKGERKTAEIDIVGLNEKKKEICFGECKWQDRVNAERVLSELKNKSELVEWNKGKRKEYYALFARSFKSKIREENTHCYDLQDFEKSIER
ncbi:MAG: ATP-binding protein [Candidatus Thermoplasmatota archaeon]|nr:ATP-binding protein [Candidatus Thermoplasmatota archaeon]